MKLIEVPLKYASNISTIKCTIAGVDNINKNKLNKKLFINVLPTFIGWIGMNNKNLKPYLIVPFTTVLKIYIVILENKIELINLAIENSKKTKISFKNSEWGIFSLTINL